MFPIKLTFNKVVRRVSVSLPRGETILNHQVLEETARRLFPALDSQESPLTFLWSDDENDIVCCTTDEEVNEAIRVMEQQGKQTFRFEVNAPKKGKRLSRADAATSSCGDGGPKTSEEGPVHRGVRCDVCDVCPIRGIRYKCAIREDFDYCENCERACVPPFPTIKIYGPEQAPLAIFVAIRDEAKGVNHSPLPSCFGGRGFGRGFHGFGGFGRGPCGRGPCGRGPSGEAPGPACGMFGRGGGGGVRGRGRCWFGGRGRGEASGCPFGFAEASSSAQPSTKADVEARGPAEDACPEGESLAAIIFNALGSFERACNYPHKTNVSESVNSRAAGEHDSSVPAPANVAEDYADQQILDDVIRESLEALTGIQCEHREEVEEPLPLVAEESAEEIPQAEEAVAPELEAAELKVVEAEPTFFPPVEEEVHEPKSNVTVTATRENFSARFVEDVTFPDGCSVDAGVQMEKVWRLENDGPFSWPEGVALVCAGGDLLTDGPVHVPVSPLQPGELTDVSLDLSIPETTGRHVAYFRLSLPDGSMVGPRLWADIRVKESEVDWQLVGSAVESTVGTNSPARSAVFESQRSQASGNGSALPSSSNVDFHSDVQVEDVESDEEDDLSPAPLAPSAPMANLWGWERVWAAEIAQVRDMGFPITPGLLPILQQFLHVPASMSSQPVAEAGMQRVVARLLEEPF